MNNEKYNQIIDEAYENYLVNFIEPTCPPELDVQPDYYKPMTKEWFVKSIKEKGLRGKKFAKKWGLKIEERELSLEERINLIKDTEDNKIIVTYCENPGDEWLEGQVNEILAHRNIPTKLIKVTYNNETIEIYE